VGRISRARARYRPTTFKLLNVAGATYWRGDEHRPMLQRTFTVQPGTTTKSWRHTCATWSWRASATIAFRLGKELGCSFSSPTLVPGIPLFLPKARRCVT